MNNIKLIVLDVDGTLTDSNIYLDNHGNEMKSFNVKDGMAISQAIKNGIECVIITGRSSRIVEIRAKELGIQYVYQGIHDKVSKLDEISKLLGLKMNEIAYIGDDINDLSSMLVVGFSACPSDAASEVKEIASFISSYKGGRGAVREVISEILKENDLWERIIFNYQGINQ